MLSLDPESRAIEDVQRMLQDNLLPQQFAFITANFHKLMINSMISTEPEPL